MAAPLRQLVLDNEAVAALLATAPRHPERAQVLETIMAANGRTVVPTTVRCEALWDRTQPAAAFANHHVRDNDPMDRRAADRNLQLRRAVPSASLVDASIAVAAERLPGGDVVEVLAFRSRRPDGPG